MRKHRLAGLIVLILIYLADLAIAQENFEDADKLSDLMSGSTEQQFDLRHTIPGIPDVDYPIYSEVPKTSFECEGRHEGYYADIESRCQAFRICTYTARSKSGFGFLCPNGTLFSQKHFVCDWYRNVDCDDSERFFDKNDANRIGSSLDMMEAVRQMIEYPMKTISKALQQNPGSSRKPTQRHRGGNRNGNLQNNVSDNASETIESTQNRSNSARKSVTRAQVESAHSRGTKKYNKDENTVVSNENSNTAIQENEQTVQNSAEEESKSYSVESSSSNLDENVYVNSLGELSTDPGVHFDRTNAHIIAEPRYRYEKHMNFAAKVNSALNGLADVPADEKLAPDYVKHMRSTSKAESTQIDLASNINGLLDEVANDLNPNTSGYLVQAPSKTKHNFHFLSRGFSSQTDPYKYKKPKQTASTVRFTPNQLPLDDEKEFKKPVFEIADDAAGFGQSSATTTTTEEPASFGVGLDYSAPPQDSPAFEEVSYLEPPLSPPFESEDNSHATDEPTDAENIITTTPESEVYTVTPSALDLPVYAAVADTATAATATEAQNNLETTTIAPKDIGQNLVVAQQQETSNQKVKENEDTPLDEDRLDVNKEAEKLFISGLKLTANENDTEATTLKAQTPLLIQVPEDHSYLTAWITSTDSPTTVTENLLTTTTEAPATAAESGSLQDRIRNYRRLASLQRATAKPVVYGKRGHLRLPSKVGTNTSTTPKPTTTTRSYLKRVAASRLRLSRLAAAAGNRNNLNNLNPTTVASLSPVDNSLDIGDNKKLSTRNIDKETALAGNGLNDADAAKAQGIVTWESVRNSLQRFQVGRKKSSDEKNYEEPSKTSNSPAKVDEISTAARNSSMRSRNRFSNFKMPASLRNNRESLTNNNSPTKTDTTTSISQTVSSSSSTSSNSILPLSFLNVHTSSQPQNLNSVQGSIVTANTAAATATLADNTNLNSISAQSSIEPNFISFDKLTRSIADDSFLQNYRAGQTLGRTAANPITAPNVFNQARTSSSSLPTYSATATGTNDLQVSSRNAYNNQVFETPARQSFPKFNIPVPQKLTPQRPAHLPVYQAQTTSNLMPTTATPRIVIARAEGQRIESNSISSIISSLITQQQQKSPPKPTPATSYMPLNDFLTKKFGNQQPTRATQIAATYYQQTQTQQQHQQQQQQQQGQNQQNYRPSIAQQYQPQPQLNQYRPQVNYQQAAALTLTPPQPTSPTIYTPQVQQQQQQQFINKPQQQLAPATPSLQPLMTQNIFASYQQQQQKLPQFPPLATPATLQSQPSSALSSSSQQSFQKLSPQFNEGNNFLNIQLPSLTNGLIPVPNSQTAQKRNDVNYDNLEFAANASLRSVYNGASSYDVPLSSVGRLPNDIQALLSRLRSY